MQISELTNIRGFKAFVTLVTLFISGYVTAQLISAKLTLIKIPGIPFDLIFPMGFIAYSITFLCTDVISEIWGKRVANFVVILGIIANFVMLALVQVAIYAFPVAPFQGNEFQSWYAKILGSSLPVVIASLIAYICSQFHDIWAFHKWKDVTKGRFLWLRNNASTIVSQFIDTCVFISLAFYVLPLLIYGNPFIPANIIWQVIIAQWISKVFVALGDTPFCYLAVMLIRKYSFKESISLTIFKPETHIKLPVKIKP